MGGQQLQDLVQILEGAVTQSGASLVSLSEASPLLLVFLRHAGCTFCREALGDIARARPAIDRTGVRIVLVHMGDSGAIAKFIEKNALGKVDSICDPEQKLYRAFGLKRGSFLQLLGPKVLWRGFLAGVVRGHGIGAPAADSSQMPGLFLLNKGSIVRRFRHRSASDRPDYASICESLAESGSGA
jgi:peroxiredoxin